MSVNYINFPDFWSKNFLSNLHLTKCWAIGPSSARQRVNTCWSINMRTPCTENIVYLYTVCTVYTAVVFSVVYRMTSTTRMLQYAIQSLICGKNVCFFISCTVCMGTKPLYTWNSLSGERFPSVDSKTFRLCNSVQFFVKNFFYSYPVLRISPPALLPSL